MSTFIPVTEPFTAQMNEAYIYDAVRTPLGKGNPQGSLYEINPTYLLEILLQAVERRNRIPLWEIDDLIVGCTLTAGDQDGNIAEKALLNAGYTGRVSGLQINRSLVSGLESILLAASKVRSGWARITLAGGVESAGKQTHHFDDTFPGFYFRGNNLPRGIAADLTATLSGFSRERLDEFAFDDHLKARQAASAGFFAGSLEKVFDRNGLLILGTDEYIAGEVSPDALRQAPPAFEQEGLLGFDQIALKWFPAIEKVLHLHSPANTAPGADGAALVLIGDRQRGAELQLKPVASILGGFTSADPYLPGFLAVKKALAAAGKQPGDIDLWACSEFASAVSLKFQEDFKIPGDRFNPLGGNIALGFPPGCGATVALITLLEALEQRGLKTGLLSASDAGVNAALVLERP